MNDVTPYQAEAPWSAQEHRLHAVPMMTSCEDRGQWSFRHLEFFFMYHQRFWLETPQSPWHCSLSTHLAHDIICTDLTAAETSGMVMFPMDPELHCCLQTLKVPFCFVCFNFTSKVYRCAAKLCTIFAAHMEKFKIRKATLEIIKVDEKTLYTSWASFVSNSAFLVMLAYSKILVWLLWRTLKWFWKENEKLCFWRLAWTMLLG